MSTAKEKLNALSDERLAEVVRDWQVHGYDETTRQTAIDLLAERGISETELKQRGYWTNYEHQRLSKRTKAVAKIGVALVIAYVFIRGVLPLILRFVPKGYDFEITIGIWIIVILFIVLQVYWVANRARE